MVKAINSVVKRPVVRNLVLAGMLTASTLGMSSCVNKNSSKDAVQNQTEVVSKAGAEALKNNVLTSKNNAIYSKYISLRVNEELTSEEELLARKEEANKIFERFGIYTGTARIQAKIDADVFSLVFKKSIDEDFLKKDDYANSFQGHVLTMIPISSDTDVEKYQEELMKKIYMGASAQTVSNILDKKVENMTEYFTEKDVKKYHKEVNKYQKAQKKTGKDDAQMYSDLIAFKIHTMNKLAFKHIIDDNDSIYILPLFYASKLLNGEFDKQANPIYY